LAPPLAESLAISRQSLVGKLPTLVSSKKIRRLFSFSLIVSNPKFSLFTQSKPVHVLPCTIKSSGMTVSAIAVSLLRSAMARTRAAICALWRFLKYVM
jgi:hypothetical protein